MLTLVKLTWTSRHQLLPKGFNTWTLEHVEVNWTVKQIIYPSWGRVLNIGLPINRLSLEPKVKAILSLLVWKGK